VESIAKSILVGRVLMTLATLIYGVLPPFVDLTETHVFHAEWTPHSRMHMVWLLGTNSAIAVLALYFLWLHKANSAFGVRLAGILGLCVFGGFWLSASTISLYGGALSDKGGVPPVLGMVRTSWSSRWRCCFFWWAGCLLARTVPNMAINSDPSQASFAHLLRAGYGRRSTSACSISCVRSRQS
jgi:hypothetical protein